MGVSGLASFGATAPTAADKARFSMTIAMTRFGSLDVCFSQHTAFVVPRPGDNFGRSHRTVRLLIILEGEASLSAGGRTVRLGPGGGALLRGWEDYVYESDTDVRRVHVDVPADDSPFAAVLRDTPAMVWPANVPMLRVAGAALTEVVRCDESGIGAASRDALRRVAQSAFLSVVGSPPGCDELAPTRQRQRSLVLAHIAERSAAPELTPASIAADLGISRRSLQRLFEEDGVGVAEHITQSRLERALALLREPMLADVSMEEIAVRAGFGTVPRMRRAVRGATGMSPTLVREQSLLARGALAGSAA
ncbi:helix-turn-helix domain-containing protein [Xylanimonas allomyrinae]|uniref:helix-turn-helix domain-containing protein n=1 Tax=Xylanimonas allomyrinae TaxID=2509459 RepID=UPI0013A65488|nr:helix-turn-helix domain-containing protein [Xylanimonas allomyrinae]